MDLRIEKTRRAIRNALLTLLSEKELEKIKVSELCRLAEIDKSTFYLHYHDLTDLCHQLQQEAVHQVLSKFPDPTEALTDSASAIRKIQEAIGSELPLFSLLFSGSQLLQFPYVLTQELKDAIFALYPKYRDDVQMNVHLTYHVYGGFHAYIDNQDSFTPEALLEAIREAYKALERKDDVNH